MKSLGREKTFTIKYDAGEQGTLPIPEDAHRLCKEFALHLDGTVNYTGTNGQHPDVTLRRHYAYKKTDTVQLQGLIPTQALIDFIFAKLKKICMDRAKGQVLQRLIEHQLKYDSLDFLISK